MLDWIPMHGQSIEERFLNSVLSSDEMILFNVFDAFSCHCLISFVEPKYSHFVIFTRCELFARIRHILVCVKYTYGQF